MIDNQNARFRCIGSGFCGTVWLHSERGEAYKRQNGGPERSLANDFYMHQLALASFRALSTIQKPQFQIPRCYRFIRATARGWWDQNLSSFPAGFAPCDTIYFQRISPFPRATRRPLIDKYCPAVVYQKGVLSDANKDCMLRPYLGRLGTQRRRRTQETQVSPKSRAFSLRNFPLRADQMLELGIPFGDMQQYARMMAAALAMLHWVGEIDGDDIEFVLAPPSKPQPPDTGSNVFGEHTMWMLDYNLCRKMSMDVAGVRQAVKAFWRNDPYYPQPDSHSSLWTAFRGSIFIPVRSVWPCLMQLTVEGDNVCRSFSLACLKNAYDGQH